MHQCPTCRSADLRHNRFDNSSFDSVAKDALEARRAGKSAQALGTLLVWAGVEVFNRTRAEWKCLYCGGVF